jgi:hypothetical protein
MRGASGSWLILSGVLLCGSTRAAFGQAAAIPISRGVTASPTEIKRGRHGQRGGPAEELVLGFLGGHHARAWLPEPGGA